jgi:hypothetical protein
LATRRTQRRSLRWWWFLNLVLIHLFSIVGVGKVQLQSKRTIGGPEMGHLLLSHPIPKSFTKNGKEYVFKVVPKVKMVNHLDIGFCQELVGDSQ